jgi:bacillithiol biosynthesis cysteine-adding enzyme BshC
MAGAVRLEAVAESIARVAEVGGEFAGDALNLLRRAYLPERTFGEALGAWLTLLFGDYGLVLFSALAPGYKELLQSSLEVAVRERARIVEELLERGESLRQAGLAPQVAVDGQETLLFRIDGEHRFKLGFDGERYLPKRRREIGRDLEETLRWVQDDPSAFGPNVLLRPILQDCLLPTAVYVGGPAEIAYFAQSSSIAPFWGKQLAVFPRIGITLVDRKAQRRLKKHRLNVSEVIGAPFDGLLHRLVREEDAASVLDELDQWDQEVATRVRGLRSRLTPIAPGLDAMLSRTELKVNYHLNRVRNRFVDDFSQRRSHLRRHLDYLYTNLFPEQTLQERVINFNYFLMQEGPALVGRLLRTTDPFLKGHHVVYV